MRHKLFLVVALAAVLAVLVCVVRFLGGRPSEDGALMVEAAPVAAVAVAEKNIAKRAEGIPANPVPAGKPDVAAQPEEDRCTQEDEDRADAFDALTDHWATPRENGVTMKEVDEFVAQFRKVPKVRRKGCLQRALNLVPDENVMLLAGILMDKSQDKELITTVYTDILNRDERVKKPILEQIFKDKNHPCWTDTAWILDVTGELPDTK